ncbi:glycoside hydrolase family 47 protein [Xylariales sp. PMI_506]|nr:glycoside hydrolase family 47 protein [Xylariales sp. PMI_506]
MHRRTIRSHRDRGVAIAITIAFCYLLYSAWSATYAPESQRLANFMNSGDHRDFITSTPSSFNWSDIELQYDEGNYSAVPSGQRRRLPKIQHRFRSETVKEEQRRKYRRGEVRQLFQRDWYAYREYAWKKDALKPVSGGYTDQFSGWAATLVDSLDTLWIMGLKSEFEEAVEAVAELDFGLSTSRRVNTFETNIRYMGGLLSAYDLSKHPVLLEKATELGNLLYIAFNTENRMPVDFIDFEQAKTGRALSVEQRVVSASPGTLSLEMTHLSQVTGDPKYFDAASRVMHLFHHQQNMTLIPGLWPMHVSMRNQNLTSGRFFTLAGSADSLFEYLPKMTALLRGAEPMYEEMSLDFLDAADQHMLFRPMIPENEDILSPGNAFVDGNGKITLDPESEHLGCYLGATFALSGRLFNRPHDVDTGSKLTKGCIYAYKSFPTGVGPERWNMAPCKSRTECEWDEEIWQQELKRQWAWEEHLPKGFTTAKDPRYLLRPEAIESVFVLYRITGRSEFQEAAWDMFQAVRNATRTPYASGAVLDVTQPVGPDQVDDYMESFWLAETLKYFYLVFSPPDLINLDEYVLNTEAHPFLIPK